jgi:hypothetical protein
VCVLNKSNTRIQSIGKHETAAQPQAFFFCTHCKYNSSTTHLAAKFSSSLVHGEKTIVDRSHWSQVFGEPASHHSQKHPAIPAKKRPRWVPINSYFQPCSFASPSSRFFLEYPGEDLVDADVQGLRAPAHQSIKVHRHSTSSVHPLP